MLQERTIVEFLPSLEWLFSWKLLSQRRLDKGTGATLRVGNAILHNLKVQLILTAARQIWTHNKSTLTCGLTTSHSPFFQGPDTIVCQHLASVGPSLVPMFVIFCDMLEAGVADMNSSRTSQLSMVTSDVMNIRSCHSYGTPPFVEGFLGTWYHLSLLLEGGQGSHRLICLCSLLWRKASSSPLQEHGKTHLLMYPMAFDTISSLYVFHYYNDIVPPKSEYSKTFNWDSLRSSNLQVSASTSRLVCGTFGQQTYNVTLSG